MRDRPVRAALVVLAVGLVALVAAAALDREDEAFRLGVTPTRIAAELRAGEVACQTRVDVVGTVRTIGISAGTYRRPGPRIIAWIRDRRGATLARAVLAAGYADNTAPRLRLDRDVANQTVDVCLRNAGPGQVALYGGVADEAPTSRLVTSGGPQPASVALRFYADRPASLLTSLPDVADRAVLFHPAWMGAWTSWLLLVLLVIGLPLLVIQAIRRATESSERA